MEVPTYEQLRKEIFRIQDIKDIDIQVSRTLKICSTIVKLLEDKPDFEYIFSCFLTNLIEKKNTYLGFMSSEQLMQYCAIYHFYQQYRIQRFKNEVTINTIGIQEQIEKYLSNKEFFNDVLEPFYPFIDWLISKKQMLDAVELAHDLKRMYAKDSFPKEVGYSSLEEIKSNGLDLIENGIHIHLSIDFDDTLSRGAPNLILVVILKKLAEKGATIEILTAREGDRIDKIHTFIRMHMSDFKTPVTIQHSNISSDSGIDRKMEEKVQYLQNKYRELLPEYPQGVAIMHIDDYASQAKQPLNKNITWRLIPSPIYNNNDFLADYVAFQKEMSTLRP